MIVEFVTEYTAYLATLGMHVVLSSDISSSHFSVTRELSVETPAVYLQKSFHGGVLLVEVRMQDMFASINLYTAKQTSPLPTANSRLALGESISALGPNWSHPKNLNRQLFRLFTEQCAQFKNLIHVNSFVYDFHLRYLTRVLCRQELLVDWIDFVDVLRAFLQYNVTTANFAKNRINDGAYRLEGPMTSNEIFRYLFRNPERFGVRVLMFNGKPTGCFIVSFDADSMEFEVDPSVDLYFTLIMYQDTSEVPGHQLNYMIFCSHQKDIFPYLQKPISKLSSVLQGTDASLSSSTRLLRLPTTADIDQPSLSDMNIAAERKLKTIVDLALKFYGRDSLWRRLIACLKQTSNQNQRISQQFTLTDFLILSTRYNTKPLLQFDPALEALFSLRDLNWNNVLDFLAASYPSCLEFNERRKTAVDREDDAEVIRHLILLNPKDEDLLVHVAFNATRGDVVDAVAVSRELRDVKLFGSASSGIDSPDTISTSVELNFVSAIVRSLCLFIYLA